MKFTPQAVWLPRANRSVLKGIANSASQPRSVIRERTSQTPSQRTLNDDEPLREEPVGPRTEARLVEPPGVEPTPPELGGLPRDGMLVRPDWPAFVTRPSTSMPCGLFPKT